MINNRIYICTDCKKLYVHESVNQKLYCPLCKKELIERGIKQINWDKYTKEEKSILVTQAINSDEHKKNKYIRKEDSPLAWHKFNRYFRVPASILYLLAYMYVYNFNFLCVIIMISLLMFLIGSFKWKKYAYYGMISTIVVDLILVLDIASKSSNSSIVIPAIITSTLEYIYYSKRKNLFNGKKEDDEYISSISIEDFDLNEINELKA